MMLTSSSSFFFFPLTGEFVVGVLSCGFTLNRVLLAKAVCGTDSRGVLDERVLAPPLIILFPNPDLRWFSYGRRYLK